MAATVVVYVNRNLEAADAVAVTASRHPSMLQLDPTAATDVLLPLVGGRDRLLGNALHGRRRTATSLAWARPPDPKVEGQAGPGLPAAGRRAARDDGEPDARRAGRQRARHRPRLSDHRTDGGVVGVLGLSVHLEALEQVLGSIPLPAGSVVTLTDADSIVVARSLDADAYVGRPTAAPGQQRDPADVPAIGRPSPVSTASSACSGTPWSSAGRGSPASAFPPRWRWRAPRRSAGATSRSPSASTLSCCFCSTPDRRAALAARPSITSMPPRAASAAAICRRSTEQRMPTRGDGSPAADRRRDDHQPADARASRLRRRWTRSGGCAKSCSRCSSRSSGRSGWRRSACSCRASRTS